MSTSRNAERITNDSDVWPSRWLEVADGVSRASYERGICDSRAIQERVESELHGLRPKWGNWGPILVLSSCQNSKFQEGGPKCCLCILGVN